MLGVGLVDNLAVEEDEAAVEDAAEVVLDMISLLRWTLSSKCIPSVRLVDGPREK